MHDLDDDGEFGPEGRSPRVPPGAGVIVWMFLSAIAWMVAAVCYWR
jgi:hypothetical protein